MFFAVLYYDSGGWFFYGLSGVGGLCFPFGWEVVCGEFPVCFKHGFKVCSHGVDSVFSCGVGRCGCVSHCLEELHVGVR